MAILYVCRDCQGRGRRKRSGLVKGWSVKCRSCDGTGKKKHPPLTVKPVS